MGHRSDGRAGEAVSEDRRLSTFEKRCGSFTLCVSQPSPSWVTIKWEGEELRVGDYRTPIKIEDLNDLRYLIDRALVGER